MNERAPVYTVSEAFGVLLGALAVTGIMCALGWIATVNGHTMFFTSIAGSGCLMLAAPSDRLTSLWNLVGGHAVSCGIGLAAAALVPHGVMASACAVGLAIIMMWRLNVLHPPAAANPVILTGAAASPGFALLVIVLGVIALTLIRAAMDGLRARLAI